MREMRSSPDSDRLGGLAWLERTRGRLGRRERARLLAAIVRGQAAFISGRVKLARGSRPAGSRELDGLDFRPPDSAIAREAEEAAAEQTPGILGHSHRSWIYGRALAALDRTEVDPELFYAACLLHDHGLLEPVEGEDFTLRSARRARACAKKVGVDDRRAFEPADGIATAVADRLAPLARVEEDELRLMILATWEATQALFEAAFRADPAGDPEILQQAQLMSARYLAPAFEGAQGSSRITTLLA